MHPNAHSVKILSKLEMVELEAFVELTRNDPYVPVGCRPTCFSTVPQ